jgi:folate-binding protein YgfZ
MGPARRGRGHDPGRRTGAANRIAAGVPEWGTDYRAAEVFPTDINMDVMGGIDYKKGCFVGQEVASRMKRRGKIRKRTLTVRGAALEAGTEIFSAAPVGTVTSVQGEAGLALVRTDRLQKILDQSLPLTCNDQPVTFDVPDVGAKRNERPGYGGIR